MEGGGFSPTLYETLIYSVCIVLFLRRPTIPTHASYPTSASSCSSTCAIPHNDNSTFFPYDGKVVVCALLISVLERLYFKCPAAIIHDIYIFEVDRLPLHVKAHNS